MQWCTIEVGSGGINWCRHKSPNKITFGNWLWKHSNCSGNNKVRAIDYLYQQKNKYMMPLTYIATSRKSMTADRIRWEHIQRVFIRVIEMYLKQREI